MEMTPYDSFDIFSDVTEDDINLSSDGDFMLDNDKPKILLDFFEQSSKKYNYTIFITLSAANIYYKYEKDEIISELDKIISKMIYLFDLYDIEHSDVCLNGCHNNDILVKCRLGRSTILNGTETVNPYKLYSILICFKAPDFTFKESIMFMDRLTGIMFRNCIPLISQMKIYDCVAGDLMMYDMLKHYSFYKVPERPKAYSINSIINWTFFNTVICLFFGYEIQHKMMRLVIKKKNPFTGEPLPGYRKKIERRNRLTESLHYIKKKKQ